MNFENVAAGESHLELELDMGECANDESYQELIKDEIAKIISSNFSDRSQPIVINVASCPIIKPDRPINVTNNHAIKPIYPVIPREKIENIRNTNGKWCDENNCTIRRYFQFPDGPYGNVTYGDSKPFIPMICYFRNKTTKEDRTKLKEILNDQLSLIFTLQKEIRTLLTGASDKEFTKKIKNKIENFCPKGGSSSINTIWKINIMLVIRMLLTGDYEDLYEYIPKYSGICDRDELIEYLRKGMLCGKSYEILFDIIGNCRINEWTLNSDLIGYCAIMSVNLFKTSADISRFLPKWFTLLRNNTMLYMFERCIAEKIKALILIETKTVAKCNLVRIAYDIYKSTLFNCIDITWLQKAAYIIAKNASGLIKQVYTYEKQVKVTTDLYHIVRRLMHINIDFIELVNSLDICICEMLPGVLAYTDLPTDVKCMVYSYAGRRQNPAYLVGAFGEIKMYLPGEYQKILQLVTETVLLDINRYATDEESLINKNKGLSDLLNLNTKIQ